MEGSNIRIIYLVLYWLRYRLWGTWTQRTVKREQEKREDMSGYSLDVYDFGELMENPSFLDINSAWGQDSICDFSTWTQDEFDAIFSQELPSLGEGISQDAGMTVGESSVQNASPSPAGLFDTRKEMSDLKQMIADLDKRLNAIDNIVPQLVQQ